MIENKDGENKILSVLVGRWGWTTVAVLFFLEGLWVDAALWQDCSLVVFFDCLNPRVPHRKYTGCDNAPYQYT